MVALIWLLPFLFLWGTVILFGVNVPYFDDWQFWLGRLDILLGIGEVGLPEAVWTKYPPHFIPLTQIFLILFSKWGIGPYGMMVFHTVFGGLAGALFFKSLYRHFPHLIKGNKEAQNSKGLAGIFHSIEPWYFPLFLGVFFFSFCQREVWFFAFNIHFSLFLFFLSLSFYGLTFQKQRWYWTGLIGSFCAFTPWICLTLSGLLIHRKQRKSIWTHLMLLAIGLTLSRFWESGENVTTGTGGAHSFFESLGLMVLFFLRLLGSPFFLFGGGYQHPLFHFFAIVLGTVYCLYLGYLFFKKDSVLLFVPLFSFFSAGLLAAGRAQTLDYAGAASRYTMLMIPGWVALLVLAKAGFHNPQTSEFATKNYWKPCLESWKGRLIWCILGLAGMCSAINFYAEVKIRRPKLLELQATIQEVLRRTPVQFDSAAKEMIYKYHWHREAIDGMIERIEREPLKYRFFFCGSKKSC